MFTKLYIVLWLNVTMLVSLYIDSKLPYFPIEISRFSSTGYAKVIFSYGSLPLILTYYLDNMFEFHRITLLVSIFIITFFDDINYLLIHEIGVLLLLLSMFYNSVVTTLKSDNIKANIMIFLTCVMLYLIRLVLKSTFVWILVYNKNIFSFTTWYDFFTPNTFALVGHDCINIMYQG